MPVLVPYYKYRSRGAVIWGKFRALACNLNKSYQQGTDRMRRRCETDIYMAVTIGNNTDTGKMFGANFYFTIRTITQ